MNDSALRRPGLSKSMRLGYGLFFFFSFIFFLAGSFPSLLDFSELQARLTGVKTTALVTAAEWCSLGNEGDIASGGSYDTGDGSYYTYTFTGGHGKVYRITDKSVCSSGVVFDGERVTIWYQADDPTHFTVASDWTFNVIFLAGFSLPLLLCIILFLISLLRLLFVSRRGYQSISV